jgi:cGMP-dependent protein kinase
LLQSILANKPIDGSDISSLDDARQELKRLRQLVDRYHRPTQQLQPQQQINTSSSPNNHHHRPHRNAVYEQKHINQYIKNNIPKNDHVRKLIHTASRNKILFQENTSEEIEELIDIFELCEFKSGEKVITQGQLGHSFYVVECGELIIHVSAWDGTSNSYKDEIVGKYKDGAAFGELALIYGSPLVASITCEKDCKLWRIKRSEYRALIGQHRQKLEKEIMKFLTKISIPRNKRDNFFKDIFNPIQFEAMTSVVKQISFEAGDYIIRESEKGDTFYMIRCGEVDISVRNIPIMTWGHGNFFGEKALLQDDVREATLRAKTNVTCFLLTREDFNRVIGNLEEILDDGLQPRIVRSTTVQKKKMDKYELEDLELLGVLGTGTFGKVKVAKAKDTGKYYALKMRSKFLVTENDQQEKVENEYQLLLELDNPFILHLHCAMQDDKYVYFLTELLVGGKLVDMMNLSEDSTRFYSACVLLALQAMHNLSIAYRDLKPENLLLDSEGYCIIVDMGLAKKCEAGSLYTFCGTPDYLAPEVIRGTGYNWGVDYWALGVLLYELSTGRAPFESYDPTGTAKKVLKGLVDFPDTITGPMKDLIKALLTKDRTRRLGVLKGGTEDVMKHRFYWGFSWDGLLNKKAVPPFKPELPEKFDALGQPDTNDDENVKAVPTWSPDF